ncbi:acyltransferase [Photobacterium leiognathi]|uniref:acyltransferase n=1 Tax=Photobacterium leiognathi TaxID=553611 RepID=UPI002980CDCD|nr:acyltransferase [Photobacterium leiognathi]
MAKIYVYLQFYTSLIRSFLFRLIVKNTGDLTVLGKVTILNSHNLKVGNNVSINHGVYINALGSISIGNNVSISAKAMIISTGLDPNKIKEKKHINKSIVIGDDVQIGAGAIILPGIHIGNNIIIGAGSVVTKSIDSNQIVAGNPARKIRDI